MNTCPKCGQPTDPGAAFCGNCGQPLQQAPTAQPQVPQQPAAAYVPQPSYAPEQPAPAPQVVTSQPAYQQPVIETTPQPTPVLAGYPAPAATPYVSAPSTVPAYATSQVSPAVRKAEVMAIIALVLGVIGIPGSLIPVVGVIFGITGLILGTIALSKYKRLLSILAVVFSSLALICGLGIWAFNVAHTSLLSSAGTTSGNDVQITTPCYTVSLSKSYMNTTPTTCDFDALTGAKDKEMTVTAITNVDFNTQSMNTLAPQLVSDFAQKVGASITAHHTGQFAGSPAYFATIAATNNNPNAVVAVILHPTAEGSNVFLLMQANYSSASASFGTIESTWQWR